MREYNVSGESCFAALHQTAETIVITRFFTRLGLIFLLMVSSGGPVIVNAQDGSGSHRRLRLPRNSPETPQMQLARLLQYLQALKQQNSDAEISPEEAAKQLEQLKETLGPELGGMLDQIPDDVAQRAMQDPQMRNQVKQMLKDYLQSRQPPRFKPGRNLSTEPGAPPEQQNIFNVGKPGQAQQSQGPSSPAQSGDLQQFSPERPPQKPSDALDSNRPLTPTAPQRDSANDLQQSPKERLSDLIDQMRQKWMPDPEVLPGNDRPATDNLRKNEPRPQSRESIDRRSQEAGEVKPPDRNRAMTDEEIYELIRRQRESVREHNRSSSDNRNSETQQTRPGRQPQDDDRSSIPGMNTQRDDRLSESSDENRSTGDQRNSASDSDVSSSLPDNFLDQLGGFGEDTRPSLSDFLDQAQGQPDMDLRDLDLRDLGIELPSGSGQSGNSRSGNTDNGHLSQALEKFNTQEMREKAREILDDKGLKSLLKDVVRDAKDSAKQQGDSEGGIGGFLADVVESAGMEDQVLGALGGVTDELAEAARNGSLSNQQGNDGSSVAQGSSDSSSRDVSSQSESAAGGSNSNGADTPSSAAVSGNGRGNRESSRSSSEKSAFSRLTESASEAFQEFTQSPESASSSGNSSPEILPDLGGVSFGSVILACLLVLVFVMALFIGPRILPKPSDETSEQVIASLLRQGIRTKQDVIRAFHQFALRPPHDTKHWWTHSRVVDSVADQYPQNSSRIRILSSLYEQARYLPDDAEFTDAMFQEAADVVRRVGVA